MRKDGFTLRDMIMKKILLFCGALWSIVRFMVFYFSLSGELHSSGDLFVSFLLFTFGSAHAVMAAGYCMTGVYPRSYRGIILLLAAGQIFAFLTDAALLVLGTGFFGLFLLRIRDLYRASRRVLADYIGGSYNGR